jgi:hypothetical protein
VVRVISSWTESAGIIAGDGTVACQEAVPNHGKGNSAVGWCRRPWPSICSWRACWLHLGLIQLPEWRERSRGQERDSRLVSQGRKVVYSRKTHGFPPGMSDSPCGPCGSVKPGKPLPYFLRSFGIHSLSPVVHSFLFRLDILLAFITDSLRTFFGIEIRGLT